MPPWDFLTILGCLPGVLGLWGMSIWQSHSFYIGTLFIGFFGASFLVIGVLAWLSLLIVKHLHKKVNFNPLRWALRDLSRYSFVTLSCFLSLSLGMLLLNLIPQIEASISEEIKHPEKSKLPSLFLFDVQEYQVKDLKKIIQQRQVKIDKIMPMVQATLLSVNGKIFDKGKGRNQETLTREQEREMRFRNRGFNLSYRNSLYPSEKILKGEMWQSFFNKKNQQHLPWISIESRFADRLNFKLNDVLKFEMEGRELSGIVKNIRNVKWVTFQPNFFILFQPNKIFESISKTFLVTIPKLPIEKKIQIQNAVVSKIPNISVVDISRVTTRLLSLAQKMTMALQFMSILCLIAGFIVLYSISSHQARTRMWDIGLMKSLGATFKEIQLLFLFQFGLIALGACSLGLMCSLVVSYFLSSLFFNSAWIFSPYIPLATLAGGVLLALGVTYLAVRTALKTPVKNLLN